MPSNVTDKLSQSLIWCCMPQPPPEMSSPTEAGSSSYLRGRYNSQVRQNLDRNNNSHRQRPLHLPLRVENNGIPLSDLPRPPPVAHPLYHRRRGASPRRFPTTAATGSGEDPRAGWSTTSLDEAELVRVFETIAGALEHVPYAICGLGALVDHGFAARRVTRVSILCAAHAKDIVRAWLAASGYDAYADSVGVPIPKSGGENEQGGNGNRVCRVRIKYLDEGFERLERVRSRLSNAWVLGLASQLDHAAAGYVDHMRKKERREQKQKQEQKGKEVVASNIRGSADEEDEKRKDEQALETIAGDVFWVLDKAARTKHVLEPRLLPTLLSREFWVPFTSRYVNARPEMARAGIDVAGVLAHHRAEQVLEEHDDMLRSYGVDPDNYDVDTAGTGIITQQPRPFEGMHALQTGKTLYTPDPSKSSFPPLSRVNSPAGSEAETTSSSSSRRFSLGQMLASRPSSDHEWASLPGEKKKKTTKTKRSRFLQGLKRTTSNSSAEGSPSRKGGFSQRLGFKRRDSLKPSRSHDQEDADDDDESASE
ncbi:hypothetical protein Daesc_009032 [Daldinia eschscholtzii]|uniref:Uncharacterized protein n=1 Tax=Daldinia eschscholtzii TaxID=292717 RepID=A0AAX6M8H9_9PEZI